MSLGFITGGPYWLHIFQCCLTRIAHGNSPEEVARWREERRSKFPTKAVVEEKMARQKELRERGEVGLIQNYVGTILIDLGRWLA